MQEQRSQRDLEIQAEELQARNKILEEQLAMQKQCDEESRIAKERLSSQTIDIPDGEDVIGAFNWIAGQTMSARVNIRGIFAVGKGKTYPSTGGKSYCVLVHGLKCMSQAHSAVPVPCLYKLHGSGWAVHCSGGTLLLPLPCCLQVHLVRAIGGWTCVN